MPFGFVVQGTSVLFRNAPSSASIADALRDWHPTTVLARGTERERCFVTFRPERNGRACIDVFDAPWPDDVRSPEEDPFVFASWATGMFGPFAFPGGLARALIMPSGDPHAQEHVAEHRAVVRINLSYGFGAPGDAPLLPADRDPVQELLFMLDLARALLDVEGALCVYNPNGETIFDATRYDEAVASAEAQEILPVNLWVNVRTMPHGSGHVVMDTVGAEQLGALDHEACFSPRDFTEDEVYLFLLNSIGYVVTSERPVADGDTLSGPQGTRWRGRTFEESFGAPRRRVRRFVPLERTPVPNAFGFGEPTPSPSGSLWKRMFGRR